MPNKFTNHIVSTNEELYNYLNDVNYGMNKPQFHHLSTIINGLINLPGSKSLSKISKYILSAKESSSIYRFLSHSRWDDSLLNRNRINYLDLYFERLVKPKSVGFLVIDDTVNPKKQADKMQGLSYHHSHSEGKCVWSHCVVTSNFVTGDISIPLDFKAYFSKETCEKHDKTFKNKSQIATEFVKSFKMPSNCEKLYCLVDNWYTSVKFIESVRSEGYHLIGGLKSNRNIHPSGQPIRIKEFEKTLDKNTLDVVTVRDKKYKIHEYRGSVAKLQNILILICYELDEDKLKDPVYLISTDTNLKPETIIDYYLNRWHIETNYKYMKNHLGFDEYKVRSTLSIERYFLIVFLTINFLELYRIANSRTIATIGDSIREMQSLSAIALVCFVYEKARNDSSINEILLHLKLVS